MALGQRTAAAAAVGGVAVGGVVVACDGDVAQLGERFLLMLWTSTGNLLLTTAQLGRGEGGRGELSPLRIHSSAGHVPPPDARPLLWFPWQPFEGEARCQGQQGLWGWGEGWSPSWCQCREEGRPCPRREEGEAGRCCGLGRCRPGAGRHSCNQRC